MIGVKALYQTVSVHIGIVESRPVGVALAKAVRK
jgi:hypothetical protein